MRKLIRVILIFVIVISMTLTLTACNVFDPDSGLAAVINAILRPEAEPTPTPEPESTPTTAQTPAPAPEPAPASTPEPAQVQTPEPVPELIGSRFPFSFSSLGLNGNIVTEEDLGEKELFVAYLWAVW